MHSGRAAKVTIEMLTWTSDDGDVDFTLVLILERGGLACALRLRLLLNM